jgi:hypothetical protein
MIVSTVTVAVAMTSRVGTVMFPKMVLVAVMLKMRQDPFEGLIRFDKYHSMRNLAVFSLLNSWRFNRQWPMVMAMTVFWQCLARYVRKGHQKRHTVEEDCTDEIQAQSHTAHNEHHLGVIDI